MTTPPTEFIWVFNGKSRFPGGLFSSLEKAERWIELHGLTGVLTKYPVDEGCFDWAVRTGKTSLSSELLQAKQKDKEFIGGFSSAAQDHFHYDRGRRV